MDTGRVQALGAADLAGEVHFTDAQWDSDGQTVVWRQRDGSRGTLMAQRRGGETRELTPGISVRAEVNYGGGDYTVAHRHVIYVCGGLLWCIKIEGGRSLQLTREIGAVAAPAVSADAQWIGYVRAGDDADAICVIDWNGKRSEQRLLRGDQFYMQPAWHPNGSMLACVAWNAPQMPWDGCELRLVQLQCAYGELRAESVHTVDGGRGTSIFQPEFSPDGRYLAYVSDATGWGQIYLHETKNGARRQLTDAVAEHARPAWVQGMRTLAWSRDSDAVFALRNERGRVRLWRYGLEGEGAEVSAAVDYSDFDSISAAPDDDTLACVVSASTTPKEVVAFSPRAGGGAQVIARSREATLPATALSAARAVQWRSVGDEVAHGLYYPPAGETAEGPPAIVMSHGGPTAQRTLAFYPEVQFFVSRGYAVLQVNYRGSSGYGRDYMLKMRGAWGKVDREDLLSGARFLVENGLADGARLVAMGGSAGAVSVLLALIHQPGLFAAGVCSYPVADMLALSMETHRFERHYNHNLLGPLRQAEAAYRCRSALLRADEIVDPLILFHGADDAVVPPEHSSGLAASLKRRGVPHEHHLFDGEGHGWRKDETVVAYYAAIERFLREHL